MSGNESKVEKSIGFIDTQYSSGDFNKMHKKSKQYPEENNNEVDELSKDFTEMGCIVDAVQRPPNICVENCVYESDTDGESDKDGEYNKDGEYDKDGHHEEDNYSDSFEEDKSDAEDTKIETKMAKSDTTNRNEQGPSSVKLSKSNSFMSSKVARSVSKMSDFGSLPSRPRRVNMSFSNDRVREIERHNHILLTKILSARNVRKSSIPSPAPAEPPRRPPPPGAISRKKQQRQIDYENMILLKKIQRAKSSACSIRR